MRMGLCFMVLIAWFAMHPAAAQSPVSSSEPSSSEAPSPIKFVKTHFDFGTPQLDFDTSVPDGAKVETIDMPANEPQQNGDGPQSIGKITIIGKVTVDGRPIDTTIIGYNLASAAVADRVCRYALEHDGYAIRDIMSTPTFTETRAFGDIRDADDKIVKAAFGNCLVRDNKLIGIYVLVDTPLTDSPERREDNFGYARDMASAIADNLVFSDGNKSGYGSALVSPEMRIDGKKLELAIPPRWRVLINDFDKPISARPNQEELHLVWLTDNSSTATFYMASTKRSGDIDLDAVGTQMFEAYLASQRDASTPGLLPAFAKVEPSGSRELSSFTEAGILAREFSFKTTNRQDEQTAQFVGTAVSKGGRIYLVGVWIFMPDDGSQNAFFSRLPAYTTYDLAQVALLNFLTDNTAQSP